MIQANELRLNNWVLINGKPYQIDFLCVSTEKGILVQTEGDGKASIEPIPLTPEILEKCGFKTRTPDSYYVLSWISPRNIILNRYKDDRGYFFLYPALWSPTMHIKYLHQLQNLTHALTGEELNVEWSVATPAKSE